MPNSSEADILAGQIEAASEGDWSYPFPYKDCWKLFKGKKRRVTDGFIPDLDNFSFDIAAYAGTASLYASWPQSRTDAAKVLFRQSFLENYPEYAPLLSDVSEADYPDLSRWLELVERLRVMLLQLIDKME